MSDENVNPTAADRPDFEEVTQSSRLPLLTLFSGATVWLLIGSLLGLLAMAKTHGPGFLADSAWLTYGKLKANSNGALIYGFALQGGLAVSLWLVAALGGSLVRLPFAIIAGAKVFNLAVGVGLIGVFVGDSTGYFWLEFPRYAAVLMLLGYVGIAHPLLLTFHHRRERELYPSLWFVVAAVFWFPWLFSSAYLMLEVIGVRGAVQIAVQGWYAGGLFALGLLPVALAGFLYFVPHFSGKALSSRSTVLFSFWVLAFVGACVGIPAVAPLPAWVGATSNAMMGLLVVPVLGVFVVLNPGLSSGRSVAGKFIRLGLYSAVAWAVFNSLATFEPIRRITSQTLFAHALELLFIYGVMGATLMGTAYHVLERFLAGRSAAFGAWHFQLVRVGLAMLVLGMLLSGIAQGTGLQSPDVSFAEASRKGIMLLRLSSLGEALMLVSGILFFVNVHRVCLTVGRELAGALCARCCGGPEAEVAR